MNLILGHATTLSRIPNPLPPTLLLVGPSSVGKSIVARVLAKSTGVIGFDYQRKERMGKADAQDVIRHHQMHPLSGTVRTSVLDMTRSTPEAQNALLKLLEDPPAYSRFILHSDVEPLLTLSSRCFRLQFGTLSDSEIAQILERLKTPEHVIEEASRLASGQVANAIEYANSHQARRATEKILLAVAEQNPEKVERALREALDPVEREKKDVLEARRNVISQLLLRSLRASLTTPGHALSFVPKELRLRAVEQLSGSARPFLRVTSSTWVLVNGFA